MEETKEAPRRFRRRGLVLGGLGAALGGLLGRAGTAHAENGQPMILGERNQASAPTDLEHIPPPDDGRSAFRVMSGAEGALLGAGKDDIARAVNLTGETRAGAVGFGSNLGMAALSPGTVAFLAVQGEVMGPPVDVTRNPAAGWFRSDANTGLVGISTMKIGGAFFSGAPWVTPDVPPTAVFARGVGASTGVHSYTEKMPAVLAWSDEGTGVVGRTNLGDQPGAGGLQYPPAGVVGASYNQIGVVALSPNRIGLWASSGNPSIAPDELRPAPIHASAGGDLDAICGEAFGMGVGVMGESHMGSGVHGMTLNPASPWDLPGDIDPPSGVVGMAPGEGIGICAMSESGIGLMAESDASGFGIWALIGERFFDPRTQTPAALKGASADSYGVSGLTNRGMALVGRAMSMEGVSLHTEGRLQLSSVGRATIPAGSDAVFVKADGVGADTEILVTMQGPAGDFWVEKAPDGGGFAIRTRQKMKQPVDASFFYADRILIGL